MGLFSFFKKKKEATKQEEVNTVKEIKEESKVSTKTTAEAPKEEIKTKTEAKKEVKSNTEAKEPVTKSTEKENEIAEKIGTDANSISVEAKGLAGFFEIKKSKDDRYVFNLYASNRVIIATSQIYSSASSAINGANSVIANAEKAAIEDQTLKTATDVPFPKWEIYKDKGGQFRFRLSASNGSCICHSQGYTTKANCKNGIESIIRTVKTATIDKSYLKK